MKTNGTVIENLSMLYFILFILYWVTYLNFFTKRDFWLPSRRGLSSLGSSLVLTLKKRAEIQLSISRHDLIRYFHPASKAIQFTKRFSSMQRGWKTRDRRKEKKVLWRKKDLTICKFYSLNPFKINYFSSPIFF